MQGEHQSATVFGTARSAAVATDVCTTRLAEIALALECVLREVPETDPDAERQFRRLLWLLCRRRGGAICRRADAAGFGCDQATGCCFATVALLVGAH